MQFGDQISGRAVEDHKVMWSENKMELKTLKLETEFLSLVIWHTFGYTLEWHRQNVASFTLSSPFLHFNI